MSKLVDAKIRCPKCGKEYPVKLFRTIWGEYESLRKKVMDDEVNVCTCPHCGYSFKAEYPFMYVDVREGFAVWWEPVHDPGIDADTSGYAAMFGAGSFYATAPRIADWNEFKATIMKYYNGELKGGKVENFDMSALRRDTKSRQKGCLGMLVLLLVVGGILNILL